MIRWSDIKVSGLGLSPIALDGPGLTATLAGFKLDLAAEQGRFRERGDVRS